MIHAQSAKHGANINKSAKRYYRLIAALCCVFGKKKAPDLTHQMLFKI
jgi:hypothetical protein